MQNGDAYLLGVGGYNGTNPSSSTTLQQSINALGLSINDSVASTTSTYSSQKIKEALDSTA
jgi:hypothetical protein